MKNRRGIFRRTFLLLLFFEKINVFRITRHGHDLACSPDPQSHRWVRFSILHQCSLLFINQVIWKNICIEYTICCFVKMRDSSMLFILWMWSFWTVYMKGDCYAICKCIIEQKLLHIWLWREKFLDRKVEICCLLSFQFLPRNALHSLKQ